jgi:hypothetical protein
MSTMYNDYKQSYSSHLPDGIEVRHPHAGKLKVIENVTFWDKSPGGNWYQAPTDRYRVHSLDGTQKWIATRDQLDIIGDEEYEKERIADERRRRMMSDAERKYEEAMKIVRGMGLLRDA